MQWAGPPGGTVSPCFTSGHPNEYKLVQVDSGAFWEKTGSADTSFFFCSLPRFDPQNSTSHAQPCRALHCSPLWHSLGFSSAPSEGPTLPRSLAQPVGHTLPPHRGYVWYCQEAHSARECGR